MGNECRQSTQPSTPVSSDGESPVEEVVPPAINRKRKRAPTVSKASERLVEIESERLEIEKKDWLWRRRDWKLKRKDYNVKKKD